jgi:hypothetical protein
MLSAIGSSAFPSPAGTGKSTAGLETQLAQYQVKLADWVNCPSCKTPEGKAKIAEISDKINEIKQRMKAADAANSPTDKNNDKVVSVSRVRDNISDGSYPASPQPTGNVGNRLDVFA